MRRSFQALLRLRALRACEPGALARKTTPRTVIAAAAKSNASAPPTGLLLPAAMVNNSRQFASQYPAAGPDEAAAGGARAAGGGGEGRPAGGRWRRCCEAGSPGDVDEDLQFQRELQEAGEGGDLARVFDLVEARGEDIDEESVEAALVQVAHCAHVLKLAGEPLAQDVHRHPTFQMLIDMVAHGAKRFSAPAKAHIVSLLAGHLRITDEVALDELGRSVMAGVQELGPTHLSLLVGGLAAAGHSPSVLLLDAVRDRVAELGPSEVPPQQADRINEALRKLGHPGLSDGPGLGPVAGGGEQQPGPSQDTGVSNA